MRPFHHRSHRNPLGLALFVAMLAVVVTATGLEASAHGHLPGRDGWHDPSPHGTSARDEGLQSCSICRLAHETSSAPVAPLDLQHPQRTVVPARPERTLRALAVLEVEHSPRAPPAAPTC